MNTFAAALVLAAATPSWIIGTQTNVLGQPETVAELPEARDAPGRYLKFSCSVMSGPVFEAGLGQLSFEAFAKFSAETASQGASVGLTVQDGDAILSVTALPVAGTVAAHAYTIGGSDAVRAAETVAGAKTISIASPDARAVFETSGAGPAIGRVLDACPFKG